MARRPSTDFRERLVAAIDAGLPMDRLLDAHVGVGRINRRRLLTVLAVGGALTWEAFTWETTMRASAAQEESEMPELRPPDDRTRLPRVASLAR